jgi:hypothetical protein
MMRLLMASFLWHREQRAAGSEGPLWDFFTKQWQHVCARTGSRMGANDTWRSFYAAGRLLISGPPASPSPTQFILAYRQLIGPLPSSRRPLRTLEDLAKADPLAAWLIAGPERALPETQWSFFALRYLQDCAHTKSEDKEFALLFWQYQRVRSLTYRFLRRQRLA